MDAIITWLNGALERAHTTMVGHFVKVQDNPATGMRECSPVIRAAAEISAYSKAKICAERQGIPSLIQLATEEVISLAATPVRTECVTEDVFERFYLAAWAILLHTTRSEKSAQTDA